MVVKENVALSVLGSYFDDEEGELWQPPPTPATKGCRAVLDNPQKDKAVSAAPKPMSVLRTASHYQRLFEEAGLQVLLKRRQRFSDDEMPMVLFVLFRPAKRNSE